MIDRLPPQSIEAEQSVLGSILLDRDAVMEVADFLKPEDFYRQAHGRIYAVIIELSDTTSSEIARAPSTIASDSRSSWPSTTRATCPR